MTKRPNVLFLMSDEHRADVTGYAGNRIIRTPTLDWLAQSGVVFHNAYAPSPVCIPCRQSLACGQLPRTTGVERYGQDLPPFSMTFARRFSQFAYQTAAVGKLHHSGPDQMQGWNQRPAGDMHVAPQHIAGRDEAAFADLKPPENGCGKWSNAKECHRAGYLPQRGEQEQTQAALKLIHKKYIDSRYDRPNPDQPLLLKVSYLRPHYPYLTTKEKFDYYLPRVEPFLEQQTFDHPFLSRHQVKPGRDASERELRRATAAYYGMIEEIDEDYGSIIEQLKAVGQDIDDWIIVYCSDHGEMLGEHGVWEKQKFFEGSARVPLIIRWPRQFQHRVVRENVNLCDLFATLCELCDIPLPNREQTVRGAGLDSRSLVPLMRGDTEAWHRGYHNETVSQWRGTNLMIKRNAIKYQRYDMDECASQPEVLFDLDGDPSERRNLINEPDYAAAVAAMRQRASELGFGPQADPNYTNAGYSDPIQKPVR